MAGGGRRAGRDLLHQQETISPAFYTPPTTKRYYPKTAWPRIGWVNYSEDGAPGELRLSTTRLSGETGRIVTAKTATAHRCFTATGLLRAH